MWVSGRLRFFKELLGPVLDPWTSEETIQRILATGDATEFTIAIVREKFEEVRFLDITGLKLRRNFLLGLRAIDLAFQGQALSFAVCAFTPWGVLRAGKETEKLYARLRGKTAHVRGG
jgi:hypothetical protein